MARYPSCFNLNLNYFFFLGTTFNNSSLLGRKEFSDRFLSLIQEKEVITSSDLENLGNAEDYLRVSTNLSTILELSIAKKFKTNVDAVFTFSSKVLPVLSIALATSKTVKFFHGSSPPPFNNDQLKGLFIKTF